ncbi:MAG: hypothetical protein KBC81_03275 [Candidatus Pacebacteria bacterium]|nr:hypothetical protein [Candidatus Paceibacterota bacterium]
MSNPFKDRSFNIFLVIVAVFFLTRLLAVGQIYHQDEYRWAVLTNPVFNAFVSPHPPLTKYFLRFVGESFGFFNLRYAILFFSFLNLILVHKVIKKITGQVNIALLGSALFVLSAYGAIAGLQIDIDGAILPFFGLLSYYAYLHVFEDKKRYLWWGVFALALIGGFLSKISFILFLLAIIADYIFVLFDSGRFDARKIFIKVAKFGGTIFLVGLVFYFIYSDRLSNVIQYAEHFKSLNFGSRAYFDLAFKVMKSLVWLSPLLLLPTVAGLFSREIFKKYRFWYLYLFFNLIFYLVLFDFTNLTIERYLMFLIIPTAIISSDVLFGWFRDFDFKKYSKTIIFSLLVFVGFTAFVLSVHHVALPLNPKSEYVNQIKHLDFNFLLPLTGGSGPVGFYFSASFILISWIVSIIAILGAVTSKKLRNLSIIIFVIIGLGYNILFLNEYLFGSIFGSVPNITRDTVSYIQSDPKITKVITYYDIGAYDLTVMGKYYSRFYTAPSRDYTKKITEFRGQYMVVDFPGIDKNSLYWKLITRCPTVKEFKDKEINSYVFDCGYVYK